MLYSDMKEGIVSKEDYVELHAAYGKRLRNAEESIRAIQKEMDNELEKADKARNIKEKRTIEMFNTVSKQLVEHRSSASDNRLLRLYQNGSKSPENQGFPGFCYI